ncbi:MAG TPA: DUF1761 domain-containing protein [Terrimesophilobacter sp.]|nr:DUF1761 domain-containing protein [Terrimesophilobacter sp.]HRQ00377.1 DUF1761 domain-containing protein [Terrimesophilobacter sp.]
MDINYLAVGLAALAAFFLGYLWYTVLFAKPWQRLIGMGSAPADADSPPDAPNLGRLLIGSLVLEIVMSFILAWYLGTGAGWSAGLITGALLGVVVAFAFGVNYLFEGKPFALWLINGSYNLVVFAAMGAIIGSF